VVVMVFYSVPMEIQSHGTRIVDVVNYVDYYWRILTRCSSIPGEALFIIW
jgi:hypothetical protein